MASATRSDGDGSIYEDRHGKWHGVLVVGWRDGRPQRRKVSANSRGKAASRLRELRDKIAAGQLPSGRTPTVEEWMTYWLDQIAARKLRESTLAGYRSKAGQYIVPLLGNHRLDRLRPEHVEQAWDELLSTGNPSDDSNTPLSGTTVLQAHRILSRALKVAQQRAYVQRNACTMIDAPTPSGEEMHPLTRDEALRVLQTCEGKRSAARWSVALSLGLRQGEALGLAWRDVDLDAGTVTVRQALSRVAGKGLVVGGLKSPKSRRTIALPAALTSQLRAHRKEQNAERLAAGSWWTDHGLVFTTDSGAPVDPRRDWQAWRDLLEEADVPPRRLHDARHTAATLLLLQKVQPRVVMQILGHSQISVTSNYQHVVDEMQTEAAARMDAALWGEG